MSKITARKRKRLKIEKLRSETGVGDLWLLGQMVEIHRRANLIRLKAYKVVDRAASMESRAILETELCRAMALKAGLRKLMYAPNRGVVRDEYYDSGCYRTPMRPTADEQARRMRWMA